jgi:hypothetical protein
MTLRMAVKQEVTVVEVVGIEALVVDAMVAIPVERRKKRFWSWLWWAW